MIQDIGFLDEDFGLGYFDDTDYSRRAQKAGYITVRAKAAYVYHKESKSFEKIKEKDAIFALNEKKFVARWGRIFRIAYVLTDLQTSKTAVPIIEKLARMGHQVLIMSDKNTYSRLTMSGHENIRPFTISPFLFLAGAALKIISRKKKKKIHFLITDNKIYTHIFRTIEKLLGSDVMSLDSADRILDKISVAAFK